MMEIYQENILDHNKNPRNKREMVHPTWQHQELNPLCGDEITLYLKIEFGNISDISFTGEGCAISQAATSLMTEYLLGKKLDEVDQFNEEKVKQLLGIPISHTRIKCAMLGLKTLQNVRN